MDDIGILKATNHMYNSVAFADISEELVAEAFAVACTLYKSGYIDKFYRGRGHLFRMIKIAERLEAVIRYGDHTHIRVNGAERIVCSLCARLGQRIEKSTFPYIGKAYNT